MNVSAYYYWVQWFWSLPEKVRSYWTFRYFKVNHFENIEINICRWLNKLFIACACMCVCACATDCYVADVDWAPDEVSRVQLFLSAILVLSHYVLWWKINNCFIVAEIKLLKCLQAKMLYYVRYYGTVPIQKLFIWNMSWTDVHSGKRASDFPVEV